jgi:nucleoside-diphosphate-sugar epimerase
MSLSIDEAFGGKRVLITGTTGFIGKVLLEQLMREVPGIAQFVLLLRGDRRHPDPVQRLHAQLLSSSVFERLKRSEPQRWQALIAQRVRVVGGEISQPGFGLSAPEFERLAGSIDLVINVAASVDFREPLDRALAVNADPLRELARLAQAAGGVPLVHVSTCYVNGLARGPIAETLAPPARASLPRLEDGSFEVEPLIARLRNRIAALKARVVEPAAQERALVALGIREARRLGWNDTYTFTKWLGEQVAWQHTSRQGALTIVRPSIVESAWRDPQPGWIEGMKVGDAIVLAYARGKTRVFPARPAGIADIVPADLVASAISLAAAEALLRPPQRRIYQVCSGSRQPIRVADYVRLCQAEMRGNAAAYPRLIRKPLNKPFRTVPRALFLAYLGAGFALASAADRIARLLGFEGTLAWVEALRTTRELAIVFSFYTAPRCVFDGTRLLAMARGFDQSTRARFEVDARVIDWPHYVARVHLPGLERFAIKDKAVEPAPVAAAAKPVELPG